jgi:hypothetical protein
MRATGVRADEDPVHLLVTGRVPGAVGATKQTPGRHYVRHLNGHYRRIGTLFEWRHKASLVEGERYALACMRFNRAEPGSRWDGANQRRLRPNGSNLSRKLT